MIFGAGTPRSGTRTISRYLNDAGFRIGYEATGKHCLRFGRDPEHIKQVYRDLPFDGDISYLTTLALEEIFEVYPDTKLIHYIRHPYEVSTSLIGRRHPIMNKEGDAESNLLVWTPQTGVIRHVGKGGVDLINFMTSHAARWSAGFVGNTPNGLYVNVVEQLAWYWRMAHERILDFSKTIPEDQYRMVRIEDIEDHGPLLLDWLDSDQRPEIQNLNKRTYPKGELSVTEKSLTCGIAGELMERFGYAA